MNEITFDKKNNEIECVHYKNWTRDYPIHTHSRHIVLGIVEEGQVCIIQHGEKKVYFKGEQFCILPNVSHEIKTIDDVPFSMMILCIQTTEELSDKYLQNLWQMIIDNPENEFLIEDMAKTANISPYHMIRQFKKAFGLTPHQFQIQCRIRKAQRLLEEGRSITEVAYDAGFFDESHFDRCFHKAVQLTPSDYKTAVQKEEQK